MHGNYVLNVLQVLKDSVAIFFTPSVSMVQAQCSPLLVLFVCVDSNTGVCTVSFD